MQLTIAIKNLFGCVPGKLKSRLHLWYGKDRQTFGKMLVEYTELIAPQLTIVDGILAMEVPGPGSPYPLGILTGSTNVVALDRVHCEIVDQSLSDVAVSNFEFPLMIPVNFSPFRVVTSALRHL